jgi:hypothetical protein
VTRFFASKNVVHIENIIAVLIVIAVVFDSLAWFRKDTSGIPRRLVIETWIADTVCGRKMGG